MVYLSIPSGLPGLSIDGVKISDHTVIIEASTTSRSASCPKCGQTSERVHSQYVRSPRDLPLGPYTVRLALHVHRFFCRNPDCPQRTFAERLPDIVPVRGQRTLRLSHNLRVLGFALGGEAGARVGKQLRMPVSPDTILRIIRFTDQTTYPTPRVLGVDDFALKRGQSYGTILVDLEHHRPVDALPDRKADSLAKWLRGHSGIEIITRDRSTEYARGAIEGAPQAVQIADRWHLLVNLREALERFFTHIHARLQELPLNEKDSQTFALHRRKAPRPLRSPSLAEQNAREARRERRFARWEATRKMYDEGMTIRDIAKCLNISWTTARNFAYNETFPERSPKKPQASQIDTYVEYLLKRWDDGCHNASQLWRDIREQGYSGSRKQVARWVAHQREIPAATTPKRYVQVTSSTDWRDPAERGQVSLEGPRKLAWLLLRSEEQLDKAEIAVLHRILQDQDVATVHELAQRFQRMVRQRLPEQLDGWIQTCATSAIVELRNFAIYIERDIDAVRAALTEPWSNGQVEGQITRLKLIKRQMYGRAKFELLRKRVLDAA